MLYIIKNMEINKCEESSSVTHMSANNEEEFIDSIIQRLIEITNESCIFTNPCNAFYNIIYVMIYNLASSGYITEDYLPSNLRVVKCTYIKPYTGNMNNDAKTRYIRLIYKLMKLYYIKFNKLDGYNSKNSKLMKDIYIFTYHNDRAVYADMYDHIVMLYDCGYIREDPIFVEKVVIIAFSIDIFESIKASDMFIDWIDDMYPLSSGKNEVI